MAEQILSSFTFRECYGMLFGRWCDPLPVIARDAKYMYMSLWQSLSSSEQEKLQSLLEQLEPVHQDRLLRVMYGWKILSWSLPFSTPKSTLFNVLTRLHPAHRSNVLRLLEALNQQGRERLIVVLDELEQSEQVELLEILNEHGVLEQRTILKVLVGRDGLDGFSLHRSLLLTAVPNATTILSLLKGLDPFHRSKLLRLLKGLDYTRQCKLLSVLEELDSQEQHGVLEIMSGLKRQEQERLIKFIHRQEHSEWLELLGILNEHKVLEQRMILKVLDGLYCSILRPSLYYCLNPLTTVLSPLKGLHPLDRSKLVRLLDGLDLTYQYTLLSALEGHDSQKRHEIIVMMNDLKPLEQRQVLTVLDGLDKCKRLARAYRLPAERWAYLANLSDTDRVYRLLLLKILLQLEPHEKQQLLRVLDKLHSAMRLEMLKGMYGLKLPEKKVLLRVVDSLGSLKGVQVLKVMCEYLKTGLLSLNGESYMFKSAFDMPVLSLLERQQPLSRSGVEEYLDGLDCLEEIQLLRALDTLDHQERKEIEIIRILLQWKDYKSLLQRLVQLFVCLLSICLSEDSQRGGFRNLLLDGWWLEFWEIILLAAGDVERNPGPRRMTDKELSNVDSQVLGKDDIFDVYDAVFDCRAKWNNLCLALRISPGDLSAVEEKRHGDVVACLRDGLSLWLQGCYDKVKYGPPTWRMLVDAVANSAGGDDHSLALEIAKEHRAVFIVPPRDAVGSRRDDRKRFEEMSRVFRNMYRSVIQLLRRVDVREVKDSLRHLTVPGRSAELCVPPQVYEFAASTKDLLDHLCPKYINPENTFILEDIVANFGSRRCKRLVQEYIDKFL